jgi:hypothetical protein
MAYSKIKIEDVSLPLPITQVARGLAQRFAKQQPNPQKAEQVYLNTLAVYVVNHYLQLMGISTDLAASDSWNPIVRLCVNTADLEVTGLGRLECRSIRAHEQICHIPPEVWQDRIGYMVVQIDQSFREATLLGFAQTVAGHELPLSQLQPLEDLLEHLSRLSQTIVAAQSTVPGKTLVNLSQWLQNLSETGWQTVEALLGTTETNLALSFRSADNFRKLDSDPAETGVRLAKLIDLGIQLAGQPVALVVELRPEVDSLRSMLDRSKTSIRLQVHPTGRQTLLLPNLQLVVLDESGAVFLEARARNADNYIQLQFNGEPGEHFSVKVALGSQSVTEDFVI